MAAALLIGLAPSVVQLAEQLIAAHAAYKAGTAGTNAPTAEQLLASVEATDAAIEKSAEAEISADLLT